MTRRHRSRQGWHPAAAAVALGACGRRGTQQCLGLPAFPKAAFPTAPTGARPLAQTRCWSGPLGHFSCYVYCPSPLPKSFGFCWIRSQTEDSNSALQCVHGLDIHAHAQDPERMLLSLHILLDDPSFPLKYGLSSGSQPADFRRQCCRTAVSCCPGIQYHLTDKENDS